MVTKKRLMFALLVFFLMVVGVGGMFRGVHAAGSASVLSIPQQEKTTQQVETEQITAWNTSLGLLSKIGYMILWPLVALAGLAMDNNLVYGSYLNLDAPLWKVRTVVKNLANFVLGLLFLYGVLVYALSPKKWISQTLKGISSWSDLVKKTLIAGVLVQLSWFLMMVAVDISTVLTYTVGALPTTIISQSDNNLDRKVVGMGLVTDLWTTSPISNVEAMTRYGTLTKENETINIAPCMDTQLKIENTTKYYLLWRRFPSLTIAKQEVKMEEGYCLFQGKIYAYNEWNTDSGDMFFTNLKAKQEAESVLLSADLVAGNILDPFAQAKEGGKCGILWVVPETPKSTENGKSEFYCIYQDAGLQLSDLISKGKSWTGPFVTLYASMINFGTINSSQYGLTQQLIILAVNTGLLLVLLMPLVVLVAVLFWRVLMLWLAIALSPFLVLKEVFGGLFGKRGDKLDFLNLSELIKLLLAPVFIGFALSMCLMFMMILKTSLDPAMMRINESTISSQAFQSRFKDATGLDIEEKDGKQTLTALGFIKITFDAVTVNIVRFLIQIFGLALCWSLLFAAIKSTKIGEGIGGQIQTLWEKMLMTQPIIPINGRSVGLGAALDLPDRLMKRKIRELDAWRNDDITIIAGAEMERKAIQTKRENDAYLSGDNTTFGDRFSRIDVARLDENIAQLNALSEQSIKGGGQNAQRVKTLTENFIRTYIDNAAKLDQSKMQPLMTLLKRQDESFVKEMQSRASQAGFVIESNGKEGEGLEYVITKKS